MNATEQLRSVARKIEPLVGDKLRGTAINAEVVQSEFGVDVRFSFRYFGALSLSQERLDKWDGKIVEAELAELIRRMRGAMAEAAAGLGGAP